MALEIRNITLEGLAPRDNDPFERYYVRIPTIKHVTPKGRKGTQLIGLDKTAEDLITKMDKTPDDIAISKSCVVTFLEKWFNAGYRNDIFFEHGNEIVKEELIRALESYTIHFVLCAECGKAEIQIDTSTRIPSKICNACGEHISFAGNKYVRAVLRKIFSSSKKSRRKKRS